jgi:hypothetical protein
MKLSGWAVWPCAGAGGLPIVPAMSRQKRSVDWGFPRWRGYGGARETVSVRLCDRVGCDEPGDCPAPKAPNSPERWYFCQKHAAEYNAGWDYFAGLTAEEAAARESRERSDNAGYRESAHYGWARWSCWSLRPMRISKRCARPGAPRRRKSTPTCGPAMRPPIRPSAHCNWLTRCSAPPRSGGRGRADQAGAAGRLPRRRNSSRVAPTITAVPLITRKRS